MTPSERKQRNNLLTTASLCAVGGIGILATFGGALIPAVIAATLFLTATVAALKAVAIGNPNPGPSSSSSSHHVHYVGVNTGRPKVRRTHTHTHTHGHTHHGHGHHTRKVHVDSGHGGTPARPVGKGHVSGGGFTSMFSNSRSTGNASSTIRSHTTSGASFGGLGSSLGGAATRLRFGRR